MVAKVDPNRRLRFLLLCEGDAETWNSWSGISRNVVEHLRELGHQVVCGDVDLYGWRRAATLVRTFSPTRKRWWVRFHLGPEAFRARSAAARRIVDRNAGRIDAVLQIGATFEVRVPDAVPIALYCDSNIDLSRIGASSGHSEAVSLTPAEAAGVRAREEVVYARADAIFTMSHLLRENFISAFGIPPARVVTVHAGANVSVPSRETTPDVEPPSVLFVGRDFQRKGGETLLRAFRLVRAALPAARLVIIGPESIPDSFRDDAGVECLGFLPKDDPTAKSRLERAYSEARVFCLPTRFEPFGVAFLEAMLHSLPCVGPRAWAVPEIIDHDRTGLLVRPEDPEDLARALLEILSDPARARAMGAAGKARVLECFTWQRVAQAISTRFSTLARSKTSFPLEPSDA